MVFTDFKPFYISKLIKIIKKEHINLIHIDYVFGINILRFFTKIPVVYNSYNVEYIFADQIGKYSKNIPKFLRMVYSKYIYFLEKYAINFVKGINAISYIDKQNFINLYDVNEKKILINGMGNVKEIFNNPLTQEEARFRLGIDKNKFVVIYHGNYLGKDGKEALKIIKDDIAPQINDESILFLLAGRKMPHYKNTKNIKFLGFVKDLKAFLYSANIAIVPILRGSGIRIKIIDYLSATIPIISTTKGAEGLLIKNGIHGYIVNNPIDGIIKKILMLKNNPEKIKELKINIKKLLEDEYNWDNKAKLLEKRYKEIINQIEITRRE